MYSHVYRYTSTVVQWIATNTSLHTWPTSKQLPKSIDTVSPYYINYPRVFIQCLRITHQVHASAYLIPSMFRFLWPPKSHSSRTPSPRPRLLGTKPMLDCYRYISCHFNLRYVTIDGVCIQNTPHISCCPCLNTYDAYLRIIYILNQNRNTSKIPCILRYCVRPIPGLI